jgi:hypothetical protein
LEAIDRRQTDRTLLRNNLEALRQTMDWLRSLRLAYQQLLADADVNLYHTLMLARDINNLAVKDGKSPIPSETLDGKAIKQRMNRNHRLGNVEKQK